MTANGIDLSNNNGEIDLASGFSGLDFVIAKATQGLSFNDYTYNYYYNESHNLNKYFGAYHFADPSTSAADNAAHFLEVVRPSSGTMLWLDYEEFLFDVEDDVAWISGFMDEAAKLHKGIKIGLYSYLYGMTKLIEAGVRAPAYWLAYYNNTEETNPVMPDGTAWNVHQYETFNNVDRNYSRQSVAQLVSIFTW